MKTYIARDRDGELCLYFGQKPFKGSDFWDIESLDNMIYLNSDLFPEVKWEDAEPTEVSIEIVGKKAQHPQPQTKFDPKH